MPRHHVNGVRACYRVAICSAGFLQTRKTLTCAKFDRAVCKQLVVCEHRILYYEANGALDPSGQAAAARKAKSNAKKARQAGT